MPEPQEFKHFLQFSDKIERISDKIETFSDEIETLCLVPSFKFDLRSRQEQNH